MNESEREREIWNQICFALFIFSRVKCKCSRFHFIIRPLSSHKSRALHFSLVLRELCYLGIRLPDSSLSLFYSPSNAVCFWLLLAAATFFAAVAVMAWNSPQQRLFQTGNSHSFTLMESNFTLKATWKHGAFTVCVLFRTENSKTAK